MKIKGKIFPLLLCMFSFITTNAMAKDFLGAPKVVVANTTDNVYKTIKPNKTDSVYDYESIEVFANFREVSTTGIKPKTLYRSSNPIDIHGNNVRHNYADRLAREVGINAEINLANDDAYIKKLMKSSSVKKKYCYELYRDGKFFNTHLGGDGMYSRDWDKLAAAFRFMLEHEGPYLVHCRLGRDRAGLFSMLCSALAGASVDDLRKDYMLTFCNYYHLDPKSHEYNVIQKFRCNKVLYYIAHPEYALDKQNIPDDVNVYDFVPSEAAENFFRIALNFNEDEIAALKGILKANSAI